MKSITIAGRTGKDGELRRTQNGDPVLSFSVAVDDGWGDNKRTLWFDVSVWGKRADSLSTLITKGTALAVTGDLSTREHNGKTYLTVRANEVTLLGGNSQRQQSDNVRSNASRVHQPLEDEPLDDEIPF